jgi:hypothetical protein
MSTRPIGYYVHHHGAGHLNRARIIRDAMSLPVTLLGTGIESEGIALADDRLGASFDGQDQTANRPKTLHYAPLDHEGIRNRVGRITQWIADARPSLMIVDVSVEVAMLARLTSVPVLYVRLNGQRSDPAHLEAFRGAQALIAPFAQAMENPATPDWVRAKTYYAPGLSSDGPVLGAQNDTVLVIIGKGGTSLMAEAIADAARSCPDRTWRVVGNLSTPSDCPRNLVFAGWTDNMAEEVAKASVVVGAAGDGVVSLVMAADRPFVCIPEQRPFGEQHATASGLQRMGAATVCPAWPDAQEWPATLSAALALDPKGRRALNDPQAAKRLALWIEAQAASGVAQELAA